MDYKKRLMLEELLDRVRKGEDFLKFSRREIVDLQDYALSFNDIELYDKLEEYWKHKKFGK